MQSPTGARGLLTLFEPGAAGLQFVEETPWNPRLGTSYSLGIDGISFPMVLLATLLTFIAILASANIRDRTKWYFTLVLLLEAAMLGVFMAQDWTLFYLLWELTLIPLFFLFGLASMGAPGTSGFPAEFLLILSALDTHTGAGLAALAGVVLGAAYFLGIYRRAFLGPTHNSTVADATDLRARELSVRAGYRETA